jgi:hypothetical protein
MSVPIPMYMVSPLSLVATPPSGVPSLATT